ncbi:RNA-binding domain-containing protein [Saccharicrinis fermentans]|uniref:Divergent AAA domain protein n=1 Tax=Saccharicrinis fermentans DSM 9555 = JCM 21142 TaxID=869213 RepID=W7YAF7_9BACT|nr:RNA-binding domain-containing protein [Saccharicrinis fermentans]GAF05322.1 divergent AAA domain protein [Saccharicrinis fermentans DSM 9555 = JCM 21142]
MKISELIAKGESKILELKEALPKNENIAKTVIAFSNTSGGKLIIGVNDKREIVGIDDAELFQMQDKIASIIADNCSPGIMPEIYSINIEGKLVLVIEVVRGNLKPYFFKNQGKVDGTYIRLGATNRIADQETISELERQKRHISFDEEICYELEYSQLDVSPLLNKFESIGKPLNNEKLENLKLIKSENGKVYPTNALMIILGKFMHCTVKCARFKGTTMSVFIDKKEYGGDVFSILDNTQHFVLNHINLGAEIKGLYRKDIYEIPEIALREALVNAIIHRDYVHGGRDIKVGVYDDIVNIVSPGCIPNNISLEDIFNGRSEARNRVVSNIFKELGLIEQWGSGINRIISACEEHELKTPKIAEENDFFDIEFYRPRTITDEKMSGNVRKPSGKPELQPESKSAQPELQQELKALLKQGIEKEQQELQQEFKDRQPELQPESLYAALVLRLAENNLSKQGLADALGHKSISGQLKVVIAKLLDDQLIEWTIPEKPNSSKQKYKLTKRGVAFYALIKVKDKK